jgi:hypothetical protein
VRAKAVIARDLRALRKREEELRNPVVKEAVVGTEEEVVDGAQGGMTTGGEGLEQQDSTVKIEETGDASKDQQVKREASDTVAQVGDSQTKPETSDAVDLVQEQPKADVPQAAEKSQDEVKQSIEQPGDASTQPAEASAAEGQKDDKGQDVPSKEMEGTLDTNDDMNYESLFDPKSAHDDHPDLNFDDFDFGTDNAAADGQDQGQDYSMQNDGPIDLSTFGEPSDNQFGNDDGSSMLQGLETYANQVPEESGDINMLDTTNTGGANTTGDGEIINLDGGEDGVGMSGADLDLAMGLGGNETSFDDLLDGMDFEGGDDTTGLENHEFDDAYFQIGDS